MIRILWKLFVSDFSLHRMASRSVAPFLHRSPVCSTQSTLHQTSGVKTCCSTDSKRPHHCCHLSNEVENIDRTQDIPYNLQWVRRYPPKLPLSTGGSGPPSNAWLLLPTRVLSLQTTSWSVHPFWQSSWLWPTDRQTYRPRYVCNSRQRLCDAV